MTKKRYYDDCHLASFTATVTGCTPCDRGWAITLDATAFYPEGGGQACDLGTLNGIPVVDVQESGEEISHICPEPLEIGTCVSGSIDWNRRFRLMQQHTGEHIVSGVIHRRYGWHNVGFHMGADVITIDFDGPIPQEDLPTIENTVNQAIWANLPVQCWTPSPEELARLSYRTKRALPWPVRIVEIPGYDRCACCGVHTASTGEVGLVKLFTATKFHQGVRIEMACGQQALELLNTAYEQNRQVSQAFSAKIEETGAAARRMNEALAEEKFRNTGLQRKLFSLIGERYQGQEQALYFADVMEPGLVRELADTLSHHVTGSAMVFSGTDEEGYQFCFISQNEDLRPLGKAMLQALGGRGGGKANFQQGRISGTRAAIRSFADKWLSDKKTDASE